MLEVVSATFVINCVYLCLGYCSCVSLVVQRQEPGQGTDPPTEGLALIASPKPR